jgi:predicted 3-demethylubiquinone-9 3-methyltransferase (glyoxalase superfamily)
MSEKTYPCLWFDGQGNGQKVMEALLKMCRLIIADLEAAANS